MSAFRSRLEELAAFVAISTPVKPSTYQIQVSVPVWLVNDIKAELDKRGLDWKAGRKKRDAILKEMKP